MKACPKCGTTDDVEQRIESGECFDAYGCARRQRRGGTMNNVKKRNAFHIEVGTHDEGGYPIWLLKDDRDGTWAEFSNRVAATACLRGYEAIGFVPRPSDNGSES